MRRFHHLLTSLTFAVHALLGCGVHHATHPHEVIHEPAALACSHHVEDRCPTHEAPAPSDRAPSPIDGCQHVACSFVKADTVRVEPGEQSLLPALSVFSDVRAEAAHVDRAVLEAAGTVNLSAAELYVWHCALLI